MGTSEPNSVAFDFSRVSAVVMDEFHSFTDPERGIVWELSLGLLPRAHPPAAAVGHGGQLRRVPALAASRATTESWNWSRATSERCRSSIIGWATCCLTEQIEAMAEGDDATRTTPALLFCFNREECWTVAEQLKGKRVLSDGQQKRLAAELERYDLSDGAGPKLKQLLMRGVGVHHAGVLPKYRRIVEELFQRKLLSVATCTETLSAGINLPARSVVVPSIMKGPPDKKKLIDPSSAHQIFGRAGRPQFDKEGHVFVLAHEDDVKIARWREKYDQIPEDTKDPGLMKAKKALKKKMPTRRSERAVLERGPIQQALRGAAGQPVQPRPAALAAVGLHARRLAGGRFDPPAGRQAADGPRPDRGRAAGTRPDAVDALAGGLRDARAAAAQRRGIGRPPSGGRRREGRGGQAARFLVRFRRERSPRSTGRPRTGRCLPIRRRTCRSCSCSAASIRSTRCSW